MINRETVWADTYKKDALYLDGASAAVFTAIHHYTNAGSSRLDLCSELQLNIDHGGVEMRAIVNLTADQMESLAGRLLAASERSRKLQAMMAEDEAEIAAAAKAALDCAKEAA